MTPEELEQVVNMAVERILVRMPEVIGNLMKHHAKLNKMNKKFYDEHPEFQQHKDIVVSVLEETEGKNPQIKYEDLLTQVVPIIKERISVMSKLDMHNVQDKQDINLNFDSSPMGISNGEL